MTDIKFSLLGPPLVEVDGKTMALTRRHELAVIAYLCLDTKPHRRDQLAMLLWPEVDQSTGLSRLKRVLTALRTDLPGEWLDAERSTVKLNREAQVRVDVHEFQQAIAERHPKAWAKAVNLYRDEFVSGFALYDNEEFDTWLLVQREALRRMMIGALEHLIEHHADRENFDLAVHYAERWAALDPLSDTPQYHLVLLYAITGRRVEAIQYFQRYANLLERELGLEPDNSLTELVEQIKAGDTPQPLPKAAIPRLLPMMPTLVIGREKALRELKARCGVGGSRRPATIMVGWPGVGKTTIAALLAHDSEIAAVYPQGVLWASLGEQPDLLAVLMGWGSALGIVSAGRTFKLDELVSLFSAVMRERKMLLVVDDVWHIEHATPFRFGGVQCALVFTTRFNDVARALAPTAEDVYRLAVLTDDDSLALLEKLTPHTVHAYPDLCRELVKDLEGLPLALQVAGRLLEAESHFGWGVGELLVELREGSQLLEAAAPADRLEWMQDTSPTVAALLKKSTDSLDEHTRERFAYLGVLAPKPATFDLRSMAAIWDTDDPKPTVRMLVDRGLLEPNGQRFQMHALLVMHARTLLHG